MKIPDEKLKELQRQNADVVIIAPRSGEEIAVKPPSEAVYMKWQTTGKAGTPEAYTASRSFVFDCLVFPDRTAVDATLERRPGLLQIYVRQLVKLAGAEEEVEIRK